MAAGKLYISGQLLDCTDSTASAVELSFVCSGFCFERKFFITARHFRTSGPAALEKMFRAEYAKDIAKICTDRYSPDVTSMLSMLLSQFQPETRMNVFLMYLIGGKKSRSAYLAYESIEFDIAIFALPDSEPGWPTYVRFSQLLATDTMDYASFFAGQVAFSVGYAIDEDDRYPKYWQKYYSMVENHPVLKTINGTQVGQIDSYLS